MLTEQAETFAASSALLFLALSRAISFVLFTLKQVAHWQFAKGHVEYAGTLKPCPLHLLQNLLQAVSDMSFNFGGLFCQNKSTRQKTNVPEKRRALTENVSINKSHVTNLLNLSHTRLQRAIFPLPYQHNQMGKKHNEKMK